MSTTAAADQEFDWRPDTAMGRLELSRQYVEAAFHLIAEDFGEADSSDLLHSELRTVSGHA